MKVLISTLTLFIAFSCSLAAQAHFYKTQTLHIWAKKGLSLRNGPSMQAARSKTLPYGTKVLVTRDVRHNVTDSVIVIPAFIKADRQKTPAFVLYGYWLYVSTGLDSGYVFGGYLSTMPPYQEPSALTETQASAEDNRPIGKWLAQTVGLLDTRKDYKLNGNDFTKVYKNHTVEYQHVGEGGNGFVRYTFQRDMSFQDGFLLLNYFHNLHISAAELAACEGGELILRENYLHFETLGLGGGLYWRIHLSLENGLLILETAEGC